VSDDISSSELEELRTQAHAQEEAASILLSTKIQFERREGRTGRGSLTRIERELLGTMREYLKLHPPPTGDV